MRKLEYGITEGDRCHLRLQINPSGLWIVVTKWQELREELCVKMKTFLGFGSLCLVNQDKRLRS